MDKVFLVKKQEFILLAATAGIHRMYGFEMQADELERGEALQYLLELTEKQYLKNAEGKFLLSEEMKEIFSQIKSAETILEVHKKTGRKCILYIGENAVRVTQSLRRRESYEVQKILLSDIWRYLQEEGWIPCNSQEI